MTDVSDLCSTCGEPTSVHTASMRVRDVWTLVHFWWRTSRLRKIVFHFSRRERAIRWHLARARALDCDVYCVYHACDSRDCPAGCHT